MENVTLSIRCPRKLRDEAVKKLKESKYVTLSNFVRFQLHEFVTEGDKNE